MGILGFSAGGEVAVLAATKFDRGNPDASDAIDRQSSRPDFQVLIYPGVQAGNIVVTKDTPPAFMLCANNDAGPSAAIPVLAQALKKAGVPVEIHIYNRGGHGFGIRPGPLPIASWPLRLRGVDGGQRDSAALTPDYLSKNGWPRQETFAPAQ